MNQKEAKLCSGDNFETHIKYMVLKIQVKSFVKCAHSDK